jgi:hypothetical protein
VRFFSLYRNHDKLICLFDKGKPAAPAVAAQEGNIMQCVDYSMGRGAEHLKKQTTFD